MSGYNSLATLVGKDALFVNTLYGNTTADNVAVGGNSLNVNTTASYNTAIGKSSLWNNIQQEQITQIIGGGH